MKEYTLYIPIYTECKAHKINMWCQKKKGQTTPFWREIKLWVAMREFFRVLEILLFWVGERLPHRCIHMGKLIKVFTWNMYSPQCVNQTSTNRVKKKICIDYPRVQAWRGNKNLKMYLYLYLREVYTSLFVCHASIRMKKKKMTILG